MRQEIKDMRQENGRQYAKIHSLLGSRGLGKLLYFALFIIHFSFISCSSSERKLPVLGPQKEVNGKVVEHTIPDFSFTNQYGETVTQASFKDKIYVADFFFTSCPTICPIMKTQMLRVYEKYKETPDFAILSHTIDPRHDSVSVLKNYAKKLGIEGKKWQFVTGEQSKIYEIGEKSYMVSAQEDAAEEGGFIHSGAFILVDKKHRIRGLYDGTKEVEVSKLLKDIDVLLEEK